MVVLSPWVAIFIAFLIAGGMVVSIPATRIAMLDAVRCVRNRPALIVVPVTFTVAYEVFQGMAQALLVHRANQSVLDWVMTPVEVSRLRAPWRFDGYAAVNAMEHLAMVANESVRAFPLSAGIVVFVALFRIEWIVELFRAMRKRFPRCWLALVAGLFLCGICAVLKPGMYLFFPELIAWLGGTSGLIVAAAVNVCSMLFDMFAATYVTVALMLVVFLWIRGLSVDSMRFHRLAARRMGFALKWSVVTMTAGFLFYGIPLFLSGAGWIEADGVGWVTGPARFLFSSALLAFFPVLAILVFHNRSIQFACLESWRLMRRHALEIGTFLGAGWIAFLVLNLCRSHVGLIFGTESFAGWFSTAALSLVVASFAGWLLTAWVCLYRQLGSQAKPVPF